MRYERGRLGTILSIASAQILAHKAGTSGRLARPHPHFRARGGPSSGQCVVDGDGKTNPVRTVVFATPPSVSEAVEVTRREFAGKSVAPRWITASSTRSSGRRVGSLRRRTSLCSSPLEVRAQAGLGGPRGVRVSRFAPFQEGFLILHGPASPLARHPGEPHDSANFARRSDQVGRWFRAKSEPIANRTRVGGRGPDRAGEMSAGGSRSAQD